MHISQRTERAKPVSYELQITTAVVMTISSNSDPERSVKIGGELSKKDLERADAPVSCRISVGMGNYTIATVDLPASLKPMSLIDAALDGLDDRDVDLAQALLWTIAVNPEKCLRKIDPEDGTIASVGPSRKDFLYTREGMQVETAKCSLPSGGNVFSVYARSLATDTVQLDWTDGKRVESEGPRLWLYGTHNRLLRVDPSMVGDATGDSFLTFEVVSCGDDDLGASAAIIQYAVVDDEGSLISKRSHERIARADFIVQNRPVPSSSCDGRLPKMPTD